jgi:hypothetical protein
LIQNLADSVKVLLIDTKIPHRTFGELFMYPHRWYVKQLLKERKVYYDTNYISSNKRKFTIAPALAKKYYGFNVHDLERAQSLKFLPNNFYHLGFNVSNIIVSFGFYPGLKFGADSRKGNTSARDFLLTVIGKRVSTDINYQRYMGFYSFHSKQNEVTRVDAETVTIRPDINVFSFGASTMYIFNFRKYSLRGAFTFSEIQKKSAGSFMLGLYHSYLLFTSFDASLVLPSDAVLYTESIRSLKSISLITIGLHGGYGHTIVWRKFVLSGAANAGGGIQKTNYSDTLGTGHNLSYNPCLHLNLKAALRFDNERFFCGVFVNYDNSYTLNPTLFSTENYMGKLVAFFGYRITLRENGRKLLRSLKLIDY